MFFEPKYYMYVYICNVEATLAFGSDDQPIGLFSTISKIFVSEPNFLFDLSVEHGSHKRNLCGIRERYIKI